MFVIFKGEGEGMKVKTQRELKKKQWDWPENTVPSYEKEAILFPVCRLLLISRAAGVRGRGCVSQP